MALKSRPDVKKLSKVTVVVSFWPTKGGRCGLEQGLFETFGKYIYSLTIQLYNIGPYR